MITANLVLPSAPSAYPLMLPAAPNAVSLVFNLAFGPDFAPPEEFSSDFYLA